MRIGFTVTVAGHLVTAGHFVWKFVFVTQHNCVTTEQRHQCPSRPVHLKPVAGYPFYRWEDWGKLGSAEKYVVQNSKALECETYDTVASWSSGRRSAFGPRGKGVESCFW
ncbi:hypothetical protein ElyMa_004709100 [Elysia marginata]|uniref:Secreted protein n=1 Tax=Elysia marginata TaxID=1093978 RepID=A0AAV4I911_9GAST|nr:hypothetical protein ElyMa_004709100 [Elysia marginata]